MQHKQNIYIQNDKGSIIDLHQIQRRWVTKFNLFQALAKQGKKSTTYVENSTIVPNFMCAPAKGHLCKPCPIILDELNPAFITLQWHSQCINFFAGNILKELKIMGPHNLSNLNKKKKTQTGAAYVYSTICCKHHYIFSDWMKENFMLQTHPRAALVTKNLL